MLPRRSEIYEIGRAIGEERVDAGDAAPVDQEWSNAVKQGDFVYSVSRDFAKTCRTPALIMPGDNEPHPEVIGRELAEIMPNGELLVDWKAPVFANQQRE
jgi:hypothetical protein